MELPELYFIVQQKTGWPRWMVMIEVELMLLSVYAARERLIAMGYTNLTVSV